MALLGPITIYLDFLRPFWHYGTLGFYGNNDGRVGGTSETVDAIPRGCVAIHDIADELAAFVLYGGHVEGDDILKLEISRELAEEASRGYSRIEMQSLQDALLAATDANALGIVGE